MDNELIRLGAELVIAVILVAWGWVKRHRDMKQMIQVIDKSDTANQHFKDVAIGIGATVAQKAFKKWLK